MMHNGDDELMDPFSDDEIVGADEQLQAASGDELDFADTVNRLNPTSDQLQHFAKMRGIKHAMLDQQAPFSRTNPPSILKGSLGLQVKLLPGETRQVANWVGEDAETGPVTISLSAVQQLNLSTDVFQFADYRPSATIQFGTRSSLFTVEVDVGLGCQLTLCASMVTVQVALARGPIRNPGVEPLPVLFSGMVSFKPMVRTQNITRTVYGDTIVVGDPVLFAIPAFSKSVQLLKAGLLPTVGVLTFYGASGSGLNAIQIDYPAGQNLNIIEIPGDAIAFTFYDTATTTNNKFKAIFNLCI